MWDHQCLFGEDIRDALKSRVRLLLWSDKSLFLLQPDIQRLEIDFRSTPYSVAILRSRKNWATFIRHQTLASFE
jgi:hypothetical protein